MKKTFFIVTLLFMGGVIFGQQKSFHDFEVKTIEGETISLSKFKGKKVLVVNTASKCGLTPQYEDLQKLYQMYGGDDFVIIGFPANNFLKQEPGLNTEIKSFCIQNYGVSFPMMAKISVKGNDIHPLYKWLTTKTENGVMDSKVKWNFQKYMIDENGRLVSFKSPKTKPLNEEIVKWVKGI